MGEIARRQRPLLTVSLTTSSTTTPEIGFGEFAGGTVFIPANSSITLLTFYGAPFQVGWNSIAPSAVQNYLPLYSLSGSAITLTVVAGQCYPLPPECFGLGGLKIKGDQTGSVDISLKG